MFLPKVIRESNMLTLIKVPDAINFGDLFEHTLIYLHNKESNNIFDNRILFISNSKVQNDIMNELIQKYNKYSMMRSVDIHSCASELENFFSS